MEVPYILSLIHLFIPSFINKQYQPYPMFQEDGIHSLREKDNRPRQL